MSEEARQPVRTALAICLNPAKYPPITFGEYYKQGLDKTYGYRKQA